MKKLALCVVLILAGCALNKSPQPFSPEPVILSDYQYTYDGDIDPVDFLTTWYCDRSRHEYKNGYHLYPFYNPDNNADINYIEAIFITDGNRIHLVGYKYRKDGITHFFALNPDTNHFEYVEPESDIHSI